MIVIADTSPLNYLILIEEAIILAELYGRVMIPAAVHEELTSRSSPEPVRRWMANAPQWLEIRPVANLSPDFPSGLGRGEREAITLAQTLEADQLIVDDMSARREAERRSITVIGTLGVLREAALEGFLDIASAVDRLRNSSFYVAPEVINALLKSRQ